VPAEFHVDEDPLSSHEIHSLLAISAKLMLWHRI